MDGVPASSSLVTHYEKVELCNPMRVPNIDTWTGHGSKMPGSACDTDDKLLTPDTLTRQSTSPRLSLWDFHRESEIDDQGTVNAWCSSTDSTLDIFHGTCENTNLVTNCDNSDVNVPPLPVSEFGLPPKMADRVQDEKDLSSVVCVDDQLSVRQPLSCVTNYSDVYQSPLATNSNITLSGLLTVKTCVTSINEIFGDDWSQSFGYSDLRHAEANPLTSYDIINPSLFVDNDDERRCRFNDDVIGREMLTQHQNDVNTTRLEERYNEFPQHRKSIMAEVLNGEPDRRNHVTPPSILAPYNLGADLSRQPTQTMTMNPATRFNDTNAHRRNIHPNSAAGNTQNAVTMETHQQMYSTTTLDADDILQMALEAAELVEKNGPKQPKPKRRFTKSNNALPSAAVAIMEEWYSSHQGHPYPSPKEMQRLADEGDILYTQTKSWFIRRRKKALKLQKEQQEKERDRKTREVETRSNSVVHLLSTQKNEQLHLQQLYLQDKPLTKPTCKRLDMTRAISSERLIHEGGCSEAVDRMWLQYDTQLPDSLAAPSNVQVSKDVSGMRIRNLQDDVMDYQTSMIMKPNVEHHLVAQSASGPRTNTVQPRHVTPSDQSKVSVPILSHKAVPVGCETLKYDVTSHCSPAANEQVFLKRNALEKQVCVLNTQQGDQTLSCDRETYVNNDKPILSRDWMSRGGNNTAPLPGFCLTPYLPTSPSCQLPHIDHLVDKNLYLPSPRANSSSVDGFLPQMAPGVENEILRDMANQQWLPVVTFR